MKKDLIYGIIVPDINVVMRYKDGKTPLMLSANFPQIPVVNRLEVENKN